MKRERVSCAGFIAFAFVGLACHVSDTGVTNEAIETAQSPLIFGTDNRTEYLAITDPQLQRYADATPGLVGNGNVSCSGGTCTFINRGPYNTGDGRPLCAGVRFSGQLQAPFCSGLLVGPDLVATAGHCFCGETMPCPNDCSGFKVVFGYYADANGNSINSVPVENVYSCTGALAYEFSNDGDWAVIKLDRPVTGRAPLIAAYGPPTSLPTDHELVGIGYPNQIPLKAARDAWVKTDPASWNFQASGDIFQGNSGGPLIDLVTGVAIGVVYTTAGGDYVANGSCSVPRVCPMTGCGGAGPVFWSAYARTTWIAQHSSLPLHPALIATATGTLMM